MRINFCWLFCFLLLYSISFCIHVLDCSSLHFLDENRKEKPSMDVLNSSIDRSGQRMRQQKESELEMELIPRQTSIGIDSSSITSSSSSVTKPSSQFLRRSPCLISVHSMIGCSRSLVDRVVHSVDLCSGDVLHVSSVEQCASTEWRERQVSRMTDRSVRRWILAVCLERLFMFLGVLKHWKISRLHCNIIARIISPICSYSTVLRIYTSNLFPYPARQFWYFHSFSSFLDERGFFSIPLEPTKWSSIRHMVRFSSVLSLDSGRCYFVLLTGGEFRAKSCGSMLP